MSALEQKQLLRNIEEETKCQICNGLIDDPHLLYCGHSFCGSCIMNWFRTKKNCPICRIMAVRQPIHMVTLQKIADLLRPLGTIQERKLTRADWIELYPVENQSNYIRDADQDGVIHRCSNCGWELDEEDFCGQCMLQYEGGSVIAGDDRGSDAELSSDGSHLEQDQEDLEDFVVDDHEVHFESNLTDLLPDDDEIVLSDSESDHQLPERKRRRVIHHSEEEEESEPERYSEPIFDSYHENINNEKEQAEIRHSLYNEDIEEEFSPEEDEDEEEYADDPFDRPRSRYIDDMASEDDDEEDIPPPQPPRQSMDSIALAQQRMRASLQQPRPPVNDSSSSSSDESEVEKPDFLN